MEFLFLTASFHASGISFIDREVVNQPGRNDPSTFAAR